MAGNGRIWIIHRQIRVGLSITFSIDIASQRACMCAVLFYALWPKVIAKSMDCYLSRPSMKLLCAKQHLQRVLLSESYCPICADWILCTLGWDNDIADATCDNDACRGYVKPLTSVSSWYLPAHFCKCFTSYLSTLILFLQSLQSTLLHLPILVIL